MKPKISIIVPVYKTAAYLPRCLDSLCAQTVPELEIIAVNDASPDNAAEILAAYAARDERIKVINLPHNQGVAAARNLALQQVRGEYVGFVDSDDWVDADFYAKLYAAARANDTELAVGNIKEIDENGQEPINPYIKKVMSDIARHKLYFSQLFVLGLYQTEMLQKYGIEFTRGLAYGEDRLLPLQAAFYCRNFVFVPEAMYYYFRHSGSITTQVFKNNMFSAKIISDMLDSVACIFDFINTADFTAEDYCLVAADFLPIVECAVMNADDETYVAYHYRFRQVCDKIKYPQILADPARILLQYFLSQPQAAAERRHISRILLKILRERHMKKQQEK